MHKTLSGLIFILVLALLSGCQSPVAPAVLNATYDFGGPPLPGEARQIGDECLLPIEATYAFSGDLEGSAALDFRILIHAPCDPDGFIGKYDESWIVTGTYEGQVNGRTGTFELFYIVDITDQHLTGQMAIVPESGTGDLSGIRGIIYFDEMTDDPAPWPVTGYIYFEPSGLVSTE